MKTSAGLRARRGAVLPLVAVLIAVMTLCAAFVVDFSRAYAQKNELQTAADAAALAGVIELFQDPSEVGTAARSYSAQNEVLFRSLPDSNSEYACGVWDNASGTFAESVNCSAADNSVDFTIHDTANFIFPALVGSSGREISSTARAWMGYVDVAACVKPWAMAYEKLTTTLDPTGDPDRNLTPQDEENLRTWDRSLLRFQLRWDTDSVADPGNFGSLNLSGESGGGSDQYEEDIWGCSTRPIGRDTILYTQPGGMGQSTMDGITGQAQGGPNAHPGLCDSMVGRECRNAGGTMGVTIIAALWGYLEQLSGAGNFRVTVRQLVSFSLDSAWLEQGKPIIVGHFVPTSTTGTLSSIPSTIMRPILVK